MMEGNKADLKRLVSRLVLDLPVRGFKKHQKCCFKLIRPIQLVQQRATEMHYGQNIRHDLL